MLSSKIKTRSITNTKIYLAVAFLGGSMTLAATIGIVSRPTSVPIKTFNKADTPKASLVSETIEGDSAPYRIPTISSELRKELIKMKRGETIPVMIILKDQANLRGIRGNYEVVRERLDRVASRRDSDNSTNSFRSLVDGLNKIGQIGDIQKYWLVNAYSLKADYRTVLELATHKDVSIVDVFPTVEYQEEATNPTPQLEEAYYGPTYIKAPEAWQMGYKGEGITVGIIDTGVYEEHPALTGKIATIQSGSNQGKKAFFDGYKITPPNESQTYSHGTHVTGIILGGKAVGGKSAIDSNKFIGVAPEAKYVFGESDNSVSASLQWIADPDGNPDTKDYPVVVNNSWINSLSTSLTNWIDNLEALGITAVFSAGNSGAKGLNSIRDLHTYPSLLLVANSTEANTIYQGSSKGTVFYYGEEYMKPDIAAPGTDILSSVYPGAYKDGQPKEEEIYKYLGGTSMAAPMVTGAVALIQEAYFKKNNFYLSPQKIKSIVQLTALNLGNDSGKDVEAGSGLINIVSAIDLALNHATVKGVTKNTIGETIPFARINLTSNGLSYEFTTEKDGSYELSLPEGNFEIKFKKESHQDVIIKIDSLKFGSTYENNAILDNPSASLVFYPKNLEFFGSINSQTVIPITLYNHGYKDVKIDEILSTNPHFFVINKLPIYVAPYAEVELSVSYLPVEVGMEDAKISFVSNAENDPGYLTVKGTGGSALFSDVAFDLKIAGNPFAGTSVGYGMGSQWGDYNKDSWQDMMLGEIGFDGSSLGFAATNNKGKGFFVNESYDGIGNYLMGLKGVYVMDAYFADMDNDDDQDIVAAIYNTNKGYWRNIIIVENNGQGTYASEHYVQEEPEWFTGLTIFDFDHDGKLDIVATKTGSYAEVVLFKQTGSFFSFEKKYLTENMTSLKLSKETNCLSFDYNNDSWMDLFCGMFSKPKDTAINTYKQNPIYFLFKNDKGNKLELIQNFGQYFNTNSALRDYDNDGDLDIYMQIREPENDTGWANDYIFKNEFANITKPYITVDSPYIPKTETHMGTGPVTWTDYDNDGNADIFFTYNDKGLNRLFKDSGDHFNYEERAALEGIQGEYNTYNSNERGATWVDYDNDGDLDVYVTRINWFNSLYRNNYLEKIGSNNWLEVQLEGDVSNRDALGSRVELQFNDGKIMSDQILLTHQTDGQDPRIIHFGLGSKTVSEIKGLRIHWPNGEMQDVIVKEINKKLVIKEGLKVDLDGDIVDDSMDNCKFVSNPNQSDYDKDGKGDLCDLPPGDVNQDGILNVVDVQCTVLVSTWGMQGKTKPVPSCLAKQDLSYADLNCDGQVNVLDVQAMTLISLNLKCQKETGQCTPIYDVKIDANQNNIQDSCEK